MTCWVTKGVHKVFNRKRMYHSIYFCTTSINFLTSLVYHLKYVEKRKSMMRNKIINPINIFTNTL